MKRERIKVGIAVVLSLAIGGFIYYSYQPRLTCKEPSPVRYGIPIERDQTTFEHIYTVYNPSLQTMTIDDVKSSCNCRGVTFDRTIPPRSKGEVKATFAVARNAVGVSRADFVILANTNKLNRPVLHLRMTYSFELGVWAYPEQIDLGRVVASKPVEFTINVRQEKVSRRNPSLAQSVEAEGVSFEVLPVEDESPSKKTAADGGALLNQKVIGRFVNDNKPGYYGKKVEIHVDHPDYPLLTIPVRWESVADLNFTPTTLHFGMMEADAKSPPRTITLIAETGSIAVKQAEVSGEGFRLESHSQVASNRVAFVVEAQAGTATGLAKGQLNVTLSDGRECQAGLMFIVE